MRPSGTCIVSIFFILKEVVHRVFCFIHQEVGSVAIRGGQIFGKHESGTPSETGISDFVKKSTCCLLMVKIEICWSEKGSR
jgi:hypothetical protein